LSLVSLIEIVDQSVDMRFGEWPLLQGGEASNPGEVSSSPKAPRG
jgi:hypothetical protein